MAVLSGLGRFGDIRKDIPKIDAVSEATDEYIALGHVFFSWNKGSISILSQIIVNSNPFDRGTEGAIGYHVVRTNLGL